MPSQGRGHIVATSAARKCGVARSQREFRGKIKTEHHESGKTSSQLSEKTRVGILSQIAGGLTSVTIRILYDRRTALPPAPRWCLTKLDSRTRPCRSSERSDRNAAGTRTIADRQSGPAITSAPATRLKAFPLRLASTPTTRSIRETASRSTAISIPLLHRAREGGWTAFQTSLAACSTRRPTGLGMSARKLARAR